MTKISPDSGSPRLKARRAVPAPRSTPEAPKTALRVASLQQLASSWILDGRARNHSARTTEMNTFLSGKLLWWAKREQIVDIGVDEVRRFFLYVRTAHELPEGRWGGAEAGGRGHQAAKKAISSQTLLNYHRTLRVFFAWLVEEGVLDKNPFDRIDAPMHRNDQVQPFTVEQIEALLNAARQVPHPSQNRVLAARNRAILLLMLDTGLRVSEMVAIVWGDIDLEARRARLHGKGGKERDVFWSSEVNRALRDYVRLDGGRVESQPLFRSDNGSTAGAALTRGGVLHMIQRMGEAAGIDGVRCSPHTFRHTFAVMFLRAGGSQMALMDALGHESMEMTRRYVHFAQADREAQARQFSPVANLKKRR